MLKKISLLLLVVGILIVLGAAGASDNNPDMPIATILLVSILGLFLSIVGYIGISYAESMAQKKSTHSSCKTVSTLKSINND